MFRYFLGSPMFKSHCLLLYIILSTQYCLVGTLWLAFYTPSHEVSGCNWWGNYSLSGIWLPDRETAGVWRQLLFHSVSGAQSKPDSFIRETTWSYSCLISHAAYNAQGPDSLPISAPCLRKGQFLLQLKKSIATEKNDGLSWVTSSYSEGMTALGLEPSKSNYRLSLIADREGSQVQGKFQQVLC